MAAGGGVFKSENGLKVQLPGANLNEIANQADDLLEVHPIYDQEAKHVFFMLSRYCSECSFAFLLFWRKHMLYECLTVC